MIRAAAFRPILSNRVKHMIQHEFHSAAILKAASIFRMPAMSPTMTEGGVVLWKVKPGEEFVAGDVLLEVETDKATIDVEAQDDGVMWEILEKEGATGVPVGKPIAYLAEPGDNLETLEKPTLEKTSIPKEEPKKEESKSTPVATKEESMPSKSAATSATSSSNEIFVKANPNQKLLPSVEILLHQNHISAEDAIAKIPASGPKGRLLKGDILAYLGTINKDSVIKVSEYIRSKEHLDLSNIVLADTTPKEETKTEAAPAAPAEPVRPANIITIELTSELGEEISKDKFKYAFEKSIESAIRNTYAHKFPQYARSPSASSSFQNDMFDDLLAPAATKNRFEVYNITYKFFDNTSASTKQIIADDFDDLLGLSSPSSAPSTSQCSSKVKVEFKIKYDAKLIDSKRFVEYFEDTLLSQIPTNNLKISN